MYMCAFKICFQNVFYYLEIDCYYGKFEWLFYLLQATFDMESLQQYHLDPSLLEVKEQVGVGEHCK